jgi:hypothetical protein
MAAARRGQALLLAIIILLMLALMGGAIVALVAASIRDTATDEQRAQARALAQAGLRYADEMLTASAEGADWRPALPAYLDPTNAGYNAAAVGDTYDSFEHLRGWDPPTSGAPYFVKYRYGMDPDALALDPTVDPNQDFTDPANRLQPKENTERTAPHDHFLLRVEYAPRPGDGLSKYLRITSIGRPGEGLHVFHTLIAYKAIGIQDYLLYFHDRSRSAATAQLGVPPLDIDGDGGTISTNRAAVSGGVWPVTGANDFIPLWLNGPLRSNLNLEVRPPVAINSTGGGWMDVIELSGALEKRAEDGQTAGNQQFLVPDATGNLVDFALGTPSLKLKVGVNRLEAPGLDTAEPVTGVSRWERLSRFSGESVSGIQAGSGTLTMDSGELGYGRGIYVDNSAQRDQTETAHNTWLQPETWGGRRYVPRGALIELYDSYTFPGATPTVGPAIVITRTDDATWVNLATGRPSGSRTMVFQWPDGDGVWSKGTFTTGTDLPSVFPQPDNGVILCEGNVRIRGRLPVGATNKRYHLTVVSRGTVYVDGPLLRPSDWGGGVTANDPNNTRLALLARDDVVLNPTALAPGQVPGLPPAPFTRPGQSPLDAHWVLDPNGAQVEGIEVPAPADTANTSVLAALADANSHDSLDARVAVMFCANRGQLGSSATGTGPYLLSDAGGGVPAVPGMTGVGVPVFLADWGNLAQQIYQTGTLEYTPDSYGIASGSWASQGSPQWVTVQGGLSATGASGSQSDVLLKNLKVERLPAADQVRAGLDMTVSALLYSERGTFFVIPGDWFDPRAAVLTDVKQDLTAPTAADAAAVRLARLRRYNYRIVVNGAIAVNSAPTLTDVGTWTDHWAYPQSGSGAALFHDYAGVQYNYDWGLRTAVGNRALLPALPASPGLIGVGDEDRR